MNKDLKVWSFVCSQTVTSWQGMVAVVTTSTNVRETLTDVNKSARTRQARTPAAA